MLTVGKAGSAQAVLVGVHWSKNAIQIDLSFACLFTFFLLITVFTSQYYRAVSDMGVCVGRVERKIPENSRFHLKSVCRDAVFTALSRGILWGNFAYTGKRGGIHVTLTHCSYTG